MPRYTRIIGLYAVDRVESYTCITRLQCTCHVCGRSDPSLVAECPFNDVYTLQYGWCSGSSRSLVTPCAGHSRYKFHQL